MTCIYLVPRISQYYYKINKIMPVVSSSLAFIHMILALLEYCKDLGLFQYLMIHCCLNIGQLLSLACFILISRKIILSIRLLQITLSKTSVWFCLPYWANDVSCPPPPPPFFFYILGQRKKIRTILMRCFVSVSDLCNS